MRDFVLKNGVQISGNFVAGRPLIPHQALLPCPGALGGETESGLLVQEQDARELGAEAGLSNPRPGQECLGALSNKGAGRASENCQLG